MSDNPPAFPQQCADALDVGMVHEGMSLRDWFAGQALAGLVSNSNLLGYSTMTDIASGVRGGRDFIQTSFALADAMLAARKSGQPS